MSKNNLPLKEVSINTLFMQSKEIHYEIPIYQRNYAWEKDEISALVQDVYDAYKKDSQKSYYVGTLVSFYRGDSIYEIIDGQQRLTTVRILLAVLGKQPLSSLTYRARKKSDDTLKHLDDLKNADASIDTDSGIVNGLQYATKAYGDIVDSEDRLGFTDYFMEKVHLIHYRVPSDIDLNHYFEIMNSRGEQLEKHEIVKARLMNKLDSEAEMEQFHTIWEACGKMNSYIQQNLQDKNIFGGNYDDFLPKNYKEICFGYAQNQTEQVENAKFTLEEIINGSVTTTKQKEAEPLEQFQPIIDFSNFLLIVLKITLMGRSGFVPGSFNLDDKELLHEFERNDVGEIEPKEFIYNLVKARYLLDNYIVHHSKEKDTYENNPWMLQKYTKDSTKPKNLAGETYTQYKLQHLLSMFEVSFTARQRKNYLFYCLLYLMKQEEIKVEDYANFVERLATRYFSHVYLDKNNLNSINTPLPGAFDETILKDGYLNDEPIVCRSAADFYAVFGDGSEASSGIPLFVFNYLDYQLWKYYANELRGTNEEKGSAKRKAFFEKLGCSDFGLELFDSFYFSRTRHSLEHFYAQANADGKDGHLDKNQINCFGNYAMIGAAANSSGSNWDPKTKLDHYLKDNSKKIDFISVASLKFIIMMQMCHDNGDDGKWEFDEIKAHQTKMVGFLCDATKDINNTAQTGGRS